MTEENDKPLACRWAEIGDCRHPDWFEESQGYLDTLSIGTVVTEYDRISRHLKEGCALCLMAFIGRALHLTSARTS